MISLRLRDQEGGVHLVTLSNDGVVTIDARAIAVRASVDGSLRMDGAPHGLAYAVLSGGLIWVFLDGQVHTFDAEPEEARRRTSTRGAAPGLAGPLTAPMPATVRHIAIAVGDTVEAGDVLLLLEAMKMELPVRAGITGVVTALNCREGEMVQPGTILVQIEMPQ